MNKYIDRLPLRVLRTINTAILWASICAMAGVGILALIDPSRPVSQMPWYFWPLLAYWFLTMFYDPPTRLGIRTNDTPANIALLQASVGVFAVLVYAVMIFFLPITALGIVFLGLSLSYGIRGAKAILKSRRQRSPSILQ